MTERFVGYFKIDNSPKKINLVKVANTLPPKEQWHSYSIWEFNGKRYRPITQNAINDLDNLVKEIEKSGYTCAVKNAKRKPSSIKYAICTYGIEDFKFSKG